MIQKHKYNLKERLYIRGGWILGATSAAHLQKRRVRKEKSEESKLEEIE